MIFFYCPECREELEAEDSIKSTKMKCPSCWKEIIVPEVGVAIPPGRRSGGRTPPDTGAGFKVFIAAAVFVVLGVGGVFAVRHFVRARQEAAKPKCTACHGKGTQECRDCRGAKTFPCAGECKGTGRVRHVSGEETNCSDCGGTGRKPCGTCGGNGAYSCDKCGGTGEPKK